MHKLFFIAHSITRISQWLYKQRWHNKIKVEIVEFIENVSTPLGDDLSETLIALILKQTSRIENDYEASTS